ncbi:MAG: glycosyltransferase family 39 protein [Ignavibacteriae bacterium]|nr:glycosyltransferase family 39 protein [Ignavibacteriota bacterium]
MPQRLTLTPQRREILIVALLTLVSGALRMYGLGAKDLWLDEASSLFFARLPWSDLTSVLQRVDQHPPLYYAILHISRVFGESEAMLRAPSVLFGAAALPFVYGAARATGGRRAGVAAALLFALAPAQIRYAQEARMYTLLVCGIAAALWGVLRLAREAGKGRLSSWTGIVAGLALALHAQHSALLPAMLTQIALGLVFRARPAAERWAFARRWVFACASLGALWLPLAPLFFTQARQVATDFWIPVPDAAYVLRSLAFVYAAYADLLGVPGAVVLLVCAGAGFAGWAVLRRRAALQVRILLLIQVGGPLLLLLISLWKPVFVGRALLWSALPLYIAAGCLAAPAARSWVRMAIVCAVAALQCVGLVAYHREYRKEPWREATTAVVRGAREGDLVLFHTPTGQIPFTYYAGDRARRLRLAGIPATLFDGGWEPRMDAHAATAARARCARERRVWLVYTHFEYSDRGRLLPAALRENCVQEETRDFGPISVRSYSYPP